MNPPCHSLIVRLPQPLPAQEIAAAISGASSQVPALTGSRVWDEEVPLASGGDAASRLADREARRALLPAGPAVRVVCLRYSDGQCDVVLVAHRAAVGHDALLWLADLLCGGTPAEAAPPCPAGGGPTAGLSRDPVEWGVPEPGRAGVVGVAALDLPGTVLITREVFTAAVAMVLARYQGSAARLELGDGTLVTAELEEDAPAAALIKPVTDSARGTGTGTADRPPVARVVLTSDAPGRRYLPDLSPWPVTIQAGFADGAAVSGACWFDEGAIHPAVASALARHVTHVASQLAQSPADATCAMVRLISPSEESAIIAAGATPGPGTQPPRTIHQAFRDMAARHPSLPAVSDSRRTLTYSELEKLAARQAMGLRSAGVRAGDHVGLCMDRTTDLVVTMLAILMAGATYVPLDPGNPQDRLRYIAEDSQIRLILTDSGDFPPAPAIRCVSPAELSARAPLTDYAQLAETALPDDPAYIIYTSGSTGRPKGVVVPHRCVTALVAAADDFDLTHHDVWTLFHSSSFDFSVWEIWGCLLTGGRLVVVSYMTTRSPAEFHALLARERVTVLSQTPSAFTGLAEADSRSDAPLSLRLVVFGGEPLDVSQLGPWFSRHHSSDCRMVNMFGITETTVHVTAKTLTSADVRHRSRSVGRALPGWSVSVRDPLGRVLPAGIAGEIYVGGAGVALGYHAQPDLTAQRFLDDPLSAGKVYRSGDRGRLLPDGSIEHLGRLDRQVKIRGYRIELDEIGTLLMDDPDVRAVAVVADETGDAARTLIRAFVILTGVQDTGRLRRRLAELLPDYMVPATITAIEEFPLTANGKLDVSELLARRRLNADAPSRNAAEPEDTDGDAIATAVLRVWREVLQAPMAPDDDFFEFGGNSLLAVRVLQAMQDAGLPPASVRDLYRSRSAARLSAYLQSSQASISTGRA